MVLLGRSRFALTDSAGRYAFEDLEPGPDSLSVHYLGASTASIPVRIGPGGGVARTIHLNPRAIQVAELRVEVERLRSAKTAGFERRRKRGVGTFIDREQIERRRPVLLSSLFYGLPGVRVVAGGGLSNRTVRFRGYRFGATCRPTLFLDGAPMRAMPLDALDPEQVLAIEVYRGPATVPARFRTFADCGAIVIWTR